MGDAFDSAGTAIDAQKAALLAAIAKAGTAGRQAYEAGQADLAAHRQSAVQAALAGAAQRGAPGELSGQLESTVSQPYDRGIASLTAGAASRQGDLAARQANSDSYLTQVQGAMPVVRAQAERQLAALRAKAEMQAAKDDLSLQRSELALAAAQIRASTAGRSGGGGAGKPLSDAQLTKRLLGAASIQQEAAAADYKPLSSPAVAGKGVWGNMQQRTINANAAKTTGQTKEALARSLGVAAGLDPNQVYGVLPDKTTKTTTPKATKPADKATAQRAVLSALRSSASPGTVKAFTGIIGGTKSLGEALNFDPSLLPKDVDPARLADWLNRYYSPTVSERTALGGK